MVGARLRYISFRVLLKVVGTSRNICDFLPRGRHAVVVVAAAATGSGAWRQRGRGGDPVQGGAGIGLGRGYPLGLRGVSPLSL